MMKAWRALIEKDRYALDTGWAMVINTLLGKLKSLTCVSAQIKIFRVLQRSGLWGYLQTELEPSSRRSSGSVQAWLRLLRDTSQDDGSPSPWCVAYVTGLLLLIIAKYRYLQMVSSSMNENRFKLYQSHMYYAFIRVSSVLEFAPDLYHFRCTLVHGA